MAGPYQYKGILKRILESEPGEFEVPRPALSDERFASELKDLVQGEFYALDIFTDLEAKVAFLKEDPWPDTNWLDLSDATQERVTEEAHQRLVSVRFVILTFGDWAEQLRNITRRYFIKCPRINPTDRELVKW